MNQARRLLKILSPRKSADGDKIAETKAAAESPKPSSPVSSPRTASVQSVAHKDVETVSPISAAVSSSIAGKPEEKKADQHKTRRINISNPSEEYTSGSKVVFQKSDETRNFLMQSLSAHYLFEQLSRDELSAVVDAMQSTTKRSGEVVIRQGDVGNEFFCLEAGHCEVFVNNNKVFEYFSGGCFGELALIYNDKRAATVSAASACTLWVLGLKAFRRTLASTASSKMAGRCEFLKRVKLFQPLSNEHISRIAGVLEPCSFEAEEYIVHQGQHGDKFYIIQAGDVRCTQTKGDGTEVFLIELHASDYFGEMALMLDEPRHANVIATSAVSCLSLDRNNFNALLGSLNDLLAKQMRIRILKSVPLLSQLEDGDLERLSAMMKVQVFEAGNIIVRQNDIGSRFYIICDGNVSCTRLVEGEEFKGPQEIGRLVSQQFFGEKALIKNESRKASVIACGHVECLVLERSDFMSLSAKVRDELLRSIAERDPSAASSIKKHEKAQLENMRYEELRIMRTIGTGTFGRVKLVTHASSSRCFALKCMQKCTISEARQEANVINEKNILLECQHPFVLELVATFNHPDALYLVLELVQGGELWSYVYDREDCIPRNQFGGLDFEAVRFYTGCVVSAFQHIHGANIAYRDLKPENLLLDNHGFVKVIDMGFAKHVPYTTSAGTVESKTYTLCGTPEYLAPEIVLSKGHDQAVDCWALGCLIYELLFSRTPFQDDHQPNIFKKIINSRKTLAFPSIIWPQAVEVIRQLLTFDSSYRLGRLNGGIQDVKSHAFYAGFDWNRLNSKVVTPPFSPVVGDTADVTNFDQFDEDDYIAPFVGDQQAYAQF